MRIRIIAVGKRMPGWITEGYETYARRMPPACRLELQELNPGHRGRNASAAVAMRDEGERMLASIPDGDQVIALEVTGKAWSTEILAGQMHDWLADGRDRCLLIGGADGLHADCLARADRKWSLSALTLPHGLVRIIVAEQVYRAYSLLQGHPYHRA